MATPEREPLREWTEYRDLLLILGVTVALLLFGATRLAVGPTLGWRAGGLAVLLIGAAPAKWAWDWFRRPARHTG